MAEAANGASEGESRFWVRKNESGIPSGGMGAADDETPEFGLLGKALRYACAFSHITASSTLFNSTSFSPFGPVLAA